MPGPETTSPLGRAWALLLRRGGELVAPPGSEAGLGLLVLLAGFLVGLAMEAQVHMVTMVRVLLSEGPGAFVSALQAFPRPGPALLAVSGGLALAVVVLSGGWINVAMALARDQDVGPDTWGLGLRRTGRIIGWNVVLIGWLGLVGLLGFLAGYQAIHSGLAESRTGEVLVPSLMGIGGLALWAFTLGAAVYYLAVSCLGAIVAVAEPYTHFWALFHRAPRLFMAAAGWRGFRELVLLLFGWWTVKGLCGQLLVPFWPLDFGGQSQVFAVAGAVFQAGCTLGDGIVLLLVVLMGAVVYQDAAVQLEAAAAQPDDPARRGRLKAWPILPGRRSDAK